MRQPKEKDIGLIFDIVIANSLSKERGTLDIRVRGEKCCLELASENETFCSGPKLFGGYFGKIAPAASVAISAIWPTSILYNRKGNCDVTVSSSQNASVTNAISDKIYFDTNIFNDKIPPIMKLYINNRNISKCGTIDLNPFQNCTPMDCEEKYFGQRNYFNREKMLCDIVPKCTGQNIIYNYINNNCVDLKNIVTDADIELIKSGKTTNKTCDLKRDSDDNNINSFDAKDSKFAVPILIDMKWFNAVDALLIASAAIIFYLSICFCVFICFNLLTKRNKNKSKCSKSSKSSSKSSPKSSSKDNYSHSR